MTINIYISTLIHTKRDLRRIESSYRTTFHQDSSTSFLVDLHEDHDIM